MREMEKSLLKKKVISLYSQNFLEKIYTILRFALSPISDMEAYVPQKGKILDLGCGTGIFANILCMGSKDRNVLGIDLSSSRIATARMISKDRPNLKFITGDVNSVAFGDYGIITIIDLLHHMPYPEQEKILLKVYTKLQDNGLLIIKDLEKSPYWKYIFHYIQDSISYKGAKLYFRSSEDMVGLLRSIGFAVETIPLSSGYPHPHVLYKCGKKSGHGPN